MLTHNIAPSPPHFIWITTCHFHFVTGSHHTNKNTSSFHHKPLSLHSHHQNHRLLIHLLASIHRPFHPVHKALALPSHAPTPPPPQT